MPDDDGHDDLHDDLHDDDALLARLGRALEVAERVPPDAHRAALDAFAFRDIDAALAELVEGELAATRGDDGPLVFANIRFFVERLEHFLSREKVPVRQVVLDARAIPEIDVTAAEQLRAFIIQLRERGIAFAVAKAHLPLREAASRLGLQEWFGEQAHFGHLSDAVTAFTARSAEHGDASPPAEAP